MPLFWYQLTPDYWNHNNDGPFNLHLNHVEYEKIADCVGLECQQALRLDSADISQVAVGYSNLINSCLSCWKLELSEIGLHYAETGDW